ncbi:MAG: carbamoyl-phosphate synthase subunit L, partial [Armatimonadaceae bacterium]
VHTGDSIVVAPSQTLSDKEYQMLRTASLKIIRALGIQGGCNVQLALDPDSYGYYIIEVNPRVSRSSALASKATGYPIARVAAKIAIGLHLDEIENKVTGRTLACFEPALDYCVVKIPRWPFDKFKSADRRITTQMKATGEVMALDRSFESGLMKALRSLEIGVLGLGYRHAAAWSEQDLDHLIAVATDERIFAIAEAMRRGRSIDDIHASSHIDEWFLTKIKNLVDMELWLTGVNDGFVQRLAEAKQLGFPDRVIAALAGVRVDDVVLARKGMGIKPSYKIVDTCAAEFEAQTPYFYSSQDTEDELLRD